MASFILVIILSWKYFPVFQNCLYNKNNDIVFSLYSTGMFSLSFFFVSLVLNGIIIFKVFQLLPGAKNAILCYEISSSKTRDYDIYKIKNKRNNIFCIVILIISLFFSCISPFVHLRINDSGIYYNKIFEFKEKRYYWNELDSVSVIPRVTHGKNKNLSPQLILEFKENQIDIWDGAGLGSPDSEILIDVLYLIQKNTNIDIYFDNNFTDEIMDLLYNKSTEWKRKNILAVFDYLNNKKSP